MAQPREPIPEINEAAALAVPGEAAPASTGRWLMRAWC